MIKEGFAVGGWIGWMDGIVIKGHTSSKSIFGANKPKIRAISIFC